MSQSERIDEINLSTNVVEMILETKQMMMEKTVKKWMLVQRNVQFIVSTMQNVFSRVGSRTFANLLNVMH